MKKECLQVSNTLLNSAGNPTEASNWRFHVGDRVCCWSDDEWCPGSVVAVNWRRFDWPEEEIAPYQVELDCGLLIYVPRDAEDICKAVEKAWWELAFEEHRPPQRSIFDRPGPYLVVAPTWISATMQRGGGEVADAYPPNILQIIEVSVCGDRIRGHVLEPEGWISLRSTDDDKVFAVPNDSAYARCFRQANPKLFEDECSTDDDATPSCGDKSCALAKKHAHSHFSLNKLQLLHSRIQKEDLDQKDEKGRTALIAALQIEQLDGVKFLLQMKACPNTETNCSGQRPLHLAVHMCKEAISLLLQARADPNLQDKNPNLELRRSSRSFEEAVMHRTPLHYCAADGRLDHVMALLNAEANPNIPDVESMTPLHLAIDEEHDDVVDALLTKKADVNMGNRRMGLDSSPLLNAAYTGNQMMILKLVDARAEVNLKRKGEMTALHLAVRARHEDAARTLIAARCDIHQKSMGMTAADFAAKNGMDNLKSCLDSLMNGSN